MPKPRKPKCDCWKHDFQVCNICQGVCQRCDGTGEINLVIGAGRHRTEPCDECDGPAPDKQVTEVGAYGYHTRKIAKGKLGTIGKIQEELDELKDAAEQGVKILVACELADLYGALRDYAEKHGHSMEDLRAMAALTKAAFEKGYR